MENSDRIYAELCNERAGLWYVSDGYGAKIIVKLPSTTIKAIIKGCDMDLLFAIDGEHNPAVLHTGLRIFDDSEHPQLLMDIQRYQKDHLAIAKIMNLERVQVQFCNELNAIQTFGYIYLDALERHHILAFIGHPKRFYCGDFNRDLNISMDKFQALLNQSNSVMDMSRFDNLSVRTTFKQSQSIDHTFYAGNEPVETNIEDTLEGSQLEKEVFVVLQSIFADQVYHAPQIRSKSGTRELTDILACSQYGIFLLEAKALGIFQAVDGRSMERKVLGLQKQIKKAVGQLVGAAKSISEGRDVLDRSGMQLEIDRKIVPHGIVLISEMMHFGDWSTTVRLLIETMADCKMFIHVMDLQEFLQFIGHSNNNPDILDSLLMQRMERFVANPTLHYRTEFSRDGQGG